MTDNPTPRQVEILAFIEGFTAEHSYAPSVREIAAEFGFTPNGAQSHLNALELRGAIQRTRGVARSIRICKPMA